MLATSALGLGLPLRQHLLRRFALAVTCSSGDSQYDAAERNAVVHNKDVPFIRVQRMNPVAATVPFLGGRVVIDGENFDYSGLSVRVDGIEVAGPKIFRCVPNALRVPTRVPFSGVSTLDHATAPQYSVVTITKCKLRGISTVSSTR